MERAAGRVGNLLCRAHSAGMQQVRKASGTPQRGKAAGWVPVGTCGESTFSLFALASYFVASQSTVTVQDVEIEHLLKCLI